MIAVATMVLIALVAWWIQDHRTPALASPEKLPPASPGPPQASSSHRISAELAADWARLEQQEADVAATLWAAEVEADRYGRVVEDFWNRLRTDATPWDAARNPPARRIRVPTWQPNLARPTGIALRLPSPAPGSDLDLSAWQALLQDVASAGWGLDRVEFRHGRFDPATESRSARSVFEFVADLTHAPTRTRVHLEGPLGVEWERPATPTDLPVATVVDGSRLISRSRQEADGFSEIASVTVHPVRHAASIDPLIIHDLDADGLPEILLPGANRVIVRAASGDYRTRPLLPGAERPVAAAAMGDLDGDGYADLILARHEQLELVPGTASGAFGPPRAAWHYPGEVRQPAALALGDLDHDGDMDLFLAQYRTPYEGGSLPTPFHDARDGYPSYLLLNDGQGRFTDATPDSGLEPKRRRRTYGTSFVDLDGDHHLDLLVTSDFAGVDVYRGDGQGRFQDVTPRWISEPHAFGMSHALSDFDASGTLDLLLLGMTSPTVRRLEHLGLRREGAESDPRLRRAMTHGNRLYLSGDEGSPPWRETSLGTSLADTGWAWACADADYDLDGYPDVYVANGHETRTSVRDYEREYWLHDLHVGGSEPDPAAYLYLQSKFARTRGRGESYGGPERNRLFLNRGGVEFEEVGHLFGLAVVEDSRNAVAEDLDLDGRPDLILTHAERWPGRGQVVRLFRNALAGTGHWIGIRLPRGIGPQTSGAKVSLRLPGSRQARVFVIGTSHRSQARPILHFGLGPRRRVEELVVHWSDGRTTRLEQPETDRYHDAEPPAR